MSTCERHEVHIAGLEATLARRNAQIAKLEQKLDDATNPLMQQEEAYRRGFEAGWRSANLKLTDVAREAVSALGAVQSKAAMNYHLNLTRNPQQPTEGQS